MESITQRFTLVRKFSLYLSVSILFTVIFVGLHYVANGVPQSFLAQKLSSDFRNYNLSKHNYPFSSFGSHSILSNTGQNQYTECAVLLSVLSTNDKGLRDAVLPRTTEREGNQLCARLGEAVSAILAGKAPETRTLRPRYWWGARPVYSVMLRYFSVYEIRELIRNTTALAYMALAIALFAISPLVFWLSSPLLLFGTLFSGITYYSEVILGVPYLWAVMAAALLAGLHAARVRLAYIHLAVFCMGMVSSYIWLLDGHLISMFSWLMIIGYFASTQKMSPSEAMISMIKHMISFCSGFIAAAISGQIIKASYLGFSSIWQNMSSAVVHRSSNIGPGNAELNMSIVFDKVWGVGYWWTGLFRNQLLWDVVLWSSAAAGSMGIVIGLYRGFSGNKRILYAMLVCVLIVLSVFARLFFLQNHSVIHAFFIGRYMFIPLAMAWVFLLVALFGAAGQPQSIDAQSIEK